MHTTWGSYANVLDPLKDAPGSLVEAYLLFGYLIVWSLTAAAYAGLYVLGGVATLLLVFFSLPCVLWSRLTRRSSASSKARSGG